MKRFIYLIFFIVAYGWDPERNVSEYSVGRDYAVYNNTRFIANFGDTTYIVWERWINDSVPSPLFARWTTDNGNTWSPVTQILNDGHYASFVTSKGIGHLLVYNANLISTIYYRSTNSGQTWNQIWIELATINWSALCAFGDTIHAIWRDYDSEYLQYRRSTNNGASWEPVVNLVQTMSTLPIPSIAAWNNYVHVVYSAAHGFGDDTCKYIRSVDGGVTWSAPIVIGTGIMLYGYSCPSIACHTNYVYVVWNGGTFSEQIKYKRSTDNGATWSSAQTIGDGSWANIYASCDEYVYVTYRGTDGTLYLNRSNDYGATWLGGSQINSNAQIGYTPGASIIVELDHDAHIAWTDVRNAASGDSGEIFYMHGTLPCEPVGVEEKVTFNKPKIKLMHYGFLIQYDKRAQVEIYNILGEKIKSETIEPPEYKIFMGNEPSGIYFIKIPTANIISKSIYIKVNREN